MHVVSIVSKLDMDQRRPRDDAIAHPWSIQFKILLLTHSFPLALTPLLYPTRDSRQPRLSHPRSRNDTADALLLSFCV
jgi:hypothetical protein